MPLRRRGGVPEFKWDRTASAELGRRLRRIIDHRTFQRGHGLAGPLPPGVDLVRSGALRRGLRVVAAGSKRVRLGIGGPARAYAARVGARWPWLGLSAKDRPLAAAAFHEVLLSRKRGAR